MGRYAGKTVIVTGAASGIGEAAARAFAAEGGSVILSDVATDAGERIAAELDDRGLTARFFHADATREEEAAALVGFAVSEFGRLDVAVNNIGNIVPGQQHDEKLHEETLEHWSRNVTLNLTSCFVGMKHQIRQMLAQGHGGAIANTSSMAGLRFAPDSLGSYAAAKAAVVRLTEFAAVQYARDGIRVNVVAPGLTATPKIRQVFTPEKQDEIASRNQPMGRIMQPEELAAAFLWLCSDDASGVTGLTVPVSGGWAAT